MEILVVGAGLSGSLAAFFLREALPDAKVHVWDGARGVGGRLATARFGDDELRANMGAQELHYTEDGGAGEIAARALLEAGVASREVRACSSRRATRTRSAAASSRPRSSASGLA
ncbi:hypothetical protein JL722_10613 [Aureococcus anophagefferens]|nr:hypothetical protein JL722_10613 [Aureococcus anophagefferens]